MSLTFKHNPFILHSKFNKFLTEEGQEVTVRESRRRKERLLRFLKWTLVIP